MRKNVKLLPILLCSALFSMAFITVSYGIGGSKNTATDITNVKAYLSGNPSDISYSDFLHDASMRQLQEAKSYFESRIGVYDEDGNVSVSRTIEQSQRYNMLTKAIKRQSNLSRPSANAMDSAKELPADAKTANDDANFRPRSNALNPKEVYKPGVVTGESVFKPTKLTSTAMGFESSTVPVPVAKSAEVFESGKNMDDSVDDELNASVNEGAQATSKLNQMQDTINTGIDDSNIGDDVDDVR